MPTAPAPFWTRSAAELLAELNTPAAGLATPEAAQRLVRDGPNRLRPRSGSTALALLLRQFRSPIAILLLISAALSGFAGEATDAVIILAILLGSSLLGFWQERTASRATEELMARLRIRACVRRDGTEREIPAEEIVAGDLVVFNAGDLIPADCRVLEAKDLAVDEAALTGESFPASKDPEPVSAEAPLAQRSSALYQGSHVVTGTALGLVVATGSRTLYGSLAGALTKPPPESEFERGVRRFGYLLLQVTAVLVLVIFTLNVALHRPWLDAFMFSLALAVGLTPQLLPAIVAITLAHGARRMAQRQVLVRRLVAIEDFGGMSVLCTDKTGTLTEGRVRLHAAVDPSGQPSDTVRRLAYLNAVLQSGFDNPLDVALRETEPGDVAGYRKLDEVPYDFHRRRLSVLLETPGGERLLVTKGAVAEVLAVCDFATAEEQESVRRLAGELGTAALRTLGIASRVVDATTCTRADERAMRFLGLLAFADPPKPGIRETLDRLEALGITLKMVTGDNRQVAAAIAREVGMRAEAILTGPELRQLSAAALARRVGEVDVFAEVDPNQKEQIILALKRAGCSVGFLGDGLNDAAALHAADVGISVDTAVDVTREAASIVLLRKDLGVLAEGVQEGRRAFANTLKYVFITTSASFGNMFSMAGASLVAAFLPMLPKQILLLNLLSDLPALAIASDRVDPELVAQPRRWDLRYIRNFMVTFGLISSVFDYLTFGVLLVLAVPVSQFRTGWYLESVLSEIFVLLVIRTSRAFYRSRPSAPLLAASLAVAGISLALPYLPGASLLGFAPLPPALLLLLLGITFLLVLASELAKRLLFRNGGAATSPAPSR